jgi:uncharacterized SAM-binding protein YcdF (DUF218 family)
MILVIKKIVAAFLLPPGCLILLLMGCALFHFRRRAAGPALWFLLPALLLWGMSSAYVPQTLFASLERDLSIPARPAGDVIVLLGGGVHDGVPDLSGSGAPSEPMLARLVTAVRLQRRLGVPVLVSGGAVFAGRSSEAPVDRRFMIDMGVPADKILIEDKSRDTMENAYFSKKILEREGLKRPLLVTSAVHMRRSVEAFRRAGLKVTPVPSSFRTAPGRPFIWADWLPSASALEDTSAALHEYLGLLYYTLAGKWAASGSTSHVTGPAQSH